MRKNSAEMRDELMRLEYGWWSKWSDLLRLLLFPLATVVGLVLWPFRTIVARVRRGRVTAFSPIPITLLAGSLAKQGIIEKIREDRIRENDFASELEKSAQESEERLNRLLKRGSKGEE